MLLEREEHLILMQDALCRAAEGHGHTILIGGEAGIGKTSLVDAFAGGQGGFARILWGVCESLATPRPMGPLSDMANEIGGALLQGFQSNRPPYELFQTFLHNLREEKRASIVVIEDAHWADDASVDFMKFIARRLPRYRALLVVTYREEEVSARHSLANAIADVPADHITRIQLRALSSDAVDRLARSACRSIPNLYASTDGNPLFVTELLRTHEEGFPTTLRHIVLSRLERLSVLALELAQFVAVVPDRCELALLDRAMEESDKALQECFDRRVLVLDRGHVRYRHELVRSVVEDALSDPERRRLNGRVLARLTDIDRDTKTLSRLVHHADAAHDAQSVLRYAPLAAQEAVKRGAHAQAAAFYRTAIRYADRMDAYDHAALHEKFAWEAFSCNLKDDALQANDAAFLLWQQIGDTLAQGRNRRMRFDFSEYMSYSHNRGEFASALEDALKLLEPHGPSTDLAMAWCSYAFLLSMQGQHDAAEGFQQQALDLAEQIGDAQALTHVLLLGERRQNSFFGTPNIDRTNRAIEIALGAGLDTLAAQGYVFRALFETTAGDFRGFDRIWADAIGFVEERDFEGHRLVLEALKARHELHHGEWDAAVCRATEIRRQRELPGLADFFSSHVLGLILCRRGLPGGQDLLERALRVACSNVAAPVGGALANSVMAEAWWLAGDHAQMLRHARQAYDEAVAIRRSPWHLSRAAFWLWSAAGLSDPPEGIFPAYRMQLTGDWRGATTAWAALGCPYERALALIDGDEPAQREAFAILERLGATATIKRCRAMLSARGAQRIPRGPRPSTRSNPMGLTDREIEILHLLAKGLANAEISYQLHRSVKTVGHHVSAILAKLGAESRQEAVNIARSKGALNALH